MPHSTLANIYLELGHMQAYGKELLVVKTPAAEVPSDLVRTEYVEWAPGFRVRLSAFLGGLMERAEYYSLVADQLERNPLLAIDYLRRAFLITGNADLRTRAEKIAAGAGLEGRARNSVEALLVRF
ncbi:MAG: hypothetical protein U5R14_10770 [Gemmatimonadota bacterium]|nr:hypothetical protein [Gemmatimonadota bacterium]